MVGRTWATSWVLMLVGLVLGFCSSCTITRKVDPIATCSIAELCIKDNPAVLMAGFQPALVSQIEAKGIKARVITSVGAGGCPYRLEYTANWEWDMAMYLTFLDIHVYDSTQQIGQATYDARGGSANMNKFEDTEVKLKSLLDELFHSVTTPAK